MATVSSAANTGDTNGPYPRAKRDWRDALLLAVLLGYTAALVGLRALLDYPSLLPAVVAWLVLVSVALLVAFWFSPYRSRFWRPYLEHRQMLPTLAVTATLGSAYMLLFYKTDGRSALTTAAIWLLPASAMAVFYALTWRRPLPTFKGVNLGALLLLVAILSVFLANFVPGTDRVLDTVLPRASGRPAVPWQSQVAFAQQEAAKVNKDAVLRGIGVKTPGLLDNVVPTMELSMDFVFITPQGDQISVTFRDIDPSATARVSVDKTDAPTQDEIATGRKIAETVRIGPRDAWQLTSVEAVPTIGPHIGPSLVTIYLKSPDQYFPNDPIAWEVNYFTAIGGTNPPVAIYTVDPTTGQTISRDIRYPDPTPTP